MGFPDGQAAYGQKKLELHARLDQTKKVFPCSEPSVPSGSSKKAFASIAHQETQTIYAFH